MTTSSRTDLTQGSLLKNLIRLSLPIMFSNFVQVFYNLTDAFWLGKLGDKAVDAVSVTAIAFPLVFFISSFGHGFMIAGTALIARFKGAGELDRVKLVTGQFCLILVVFITMFILFSQLAMPAILGFLKTPPEILELAIGYNRVIFIGMAFMFILISYTSIVQGMGDTINPMKIQLVSVGINVVLDPLMIFGIGFARMETMGAAYATLIARIVGAILAVIYLMMKNKDLIPRWEDLKPDFSMMRNLFRIAIPASISNSVNSLGFVVLQGFVNTFGTVIISANSINNRMIGFYMMPAMGISSALSTIIGQNLGAKRVDRAVESVRIAMFLVVGIMAIGSAALFFYGKDLTRFFITDPAVIEIGKRMFRITSLSALTFSFMMILFGVFNGAGNTMPTMVIGVTRLWLFRIPFTYIMSGYLLTVAFFKNSFLAGFLAWASEPFAQYPWESLWWSMVASNILSGIIALMIYMRGTWKRVDFS